MTTFNDLGLSAELQQSLQKMEYKTPTPIQAQSIPMALDGLDILGSAQTGTGKTAAFSIPLVEAMLKNPLGTAMVLTPTRELAKQVLDVIKQLLGPKSGIKTAFIIGGDPIGKQFNQLKQGARIIVGTPGRVNDHLERGSLNLSQCGFLVLDETDRMLDMGFGVQLDAIVKYLPEQRQTLMFSATLPAGIVKLSNKYLTNPQRISVGETNVVAKNIKQDVIRIEQDKKYAELINQLHERTGSVIIFGKTKHGCDKLAKRLNQDGFDSDALHGDLRQNKRDKVMRRFREMKFRVLVATDIAARGLDVPHIEHVINYDLPQVAEDYIHRMGRTARAGSTGSALSFVASQDGRKWHAIEVLLGIATGKPAGGAGGRGRSGGRRNSSDRHRGGAARPFGAPKPMGGGKRKKYGQSTKRTGGENFNGGNERKEFSSDKKRGDKPFGKKRDFVARDDRTSGKPNGEKRNSFSRNEKPSGQKRDFATRDGQPSGKPNGDKRGKFSKGSAPSGQKRDYANKEGRPHSQKQGNKPNSQNRNDRNNDAGQTRFKKSASKSGRFNKGGSGKKAA